MKVSLKAYVADRSQKGKEFTEIFPWSNIVNLIEFTSSYFLRQHFPDLRKVQISGFSLSVHTYVTNDLLWMMIVMHSLEYLHSFVVELWHLQLWSWPLPRARNKSFKGGDLYYTNVYDDWIVRERTHSSRVVSGRLLTYHPLFHVTFVVETFE